MNLVGDVVECDARNVVVQRLLANDEPVFKGHYPHDPIFPGVLIIESGIQAVRHFSDMHGHGLMLEEVERVRFLSPLRPGDRFETRAQVCMRLDGTARASVDIRAGERQIAAFDLALTSARASATGRAPLPEARGIHHAPILDHALVRSWLPQRHPMLLLDRVDEVRGQREVVARKAITCTEPCYASMKDRSSDAFDYPFSLLVESFSHSVGVLLHQTWGEELACRSHVVVFGAMRGLRVYGPVQPGDVVIHHARVETLKPSFAILSGTSLVDRRTVAAYGQLTAALRPRVEAIQ